MEGNKSDGSAQHFLSQGEPADHGYNHCDLCRAVEAAERCTVSSAGKSFFLPTCCCGSAGAAIKNQHPSLTKRVEAAMRPTAGAAQSALKTVLVAVRAGMGSII
jgi:hypothetical protein